ncbi:hypothetical protein COW81_01620 [Candidatus Campbellbacteria bacterium CG22_combo_CG10-13_8_21_14_all_36_13]|uniref:prolyl oligopeptidase n=1 Tax=Candidatus Campbellbacteria bacterium CG22_combo_CG10-13_8_21_14_all_36_13 TaxID=1974529 RepID=A0A2H0DYD4_9BACT|nr:MAG: hypothetical protein COW81_01620 [Candidatus Campbellbacteria bacterium CG22_combo_CG10-13_8_21_14_all_36_13]
MNIFQPKKQDIIDDINGIKVADPYRWLEDSNDSEVKEWINLQNEQTDKILKKDSFESFSKELTNNFKVVNFSNPIPVKGRYFFTERQPDEDQSVLYVKNRLDGVPVKLFDPNNKREGNTVSIDFWSPSYSGKYIAYGISEGGDEMATLYIKDIETNEELSERIIHCRHSSVRWLPDDSAFFYTRNPRPGTVPKNEEHLHTKVYLHKLGDNPNNDELIFGADRPKDDMIGIGLSPDGKLLSIEVSQTWAENEVYIYNRETKVTKPLIVGIPSKFSVRFLRDKVLLKTNYKANNYRVLWSTYEDLYKPLDEWEDFISEREYLLESLKVTKSKILVGYLVNVCSEVFVFDYEGIEVGKIPLPKYSSLAGISGRRDEEEFFYGVVSFVFPKITYQYDPSTSSYKEYRKTDNPINPDDYEVKQEWYISNDGTSVPMFIFHKKDLLRDGTNPTILYGYGGFNKTNTPVFMRNWIPWIERGGIFVVANIRGGGEFGDKWHKGGIKENKQNSFDDFISAGEYLISQKYTSKEHLGIVGGSNGGLLVSAVGVQRPDLFNAVCSKVPLTDMARFPKFGIAIRWVHEYGNPDIKEELERILKWSPYHNVKEGERYPDFFFNTAEKDTRVDPLHARKMAAILQGVNKENKVLVFTEIEAGHGPGKPVIKIVENQALTLSFFAMKLALFK